MDSEDSDTLDESHEQYPELMKRVCRWAEVISSDSRRRSLENAGKVYCYSPIIFGKDHFSAGWSREVTDRLLTNMRYEIDPSDCFDFLSQMDMMERTYLTVWGTLRDCCGERTQDVAALMHFANHCEDETSINVILEESLTTPLFDAMRSNIDKDDKAKLTLLLCLKYYFYIVEMVVIKRKNPEKSFNDHPKKTLKKIEELKTKGNALFQRNRYRKAIEYYTEAIKIDCYNPVLYCNRAQANLYLDENWEALLDAKRATLLNPTWPKAYYRFSQALFELQYPQRALTENRLGQQLCRQKDQDIKDLQAQGKRILEEDERLDYLKKNGSTEQPSPLEELDSDELYDESNSEDENEPPAYMDNELLNLGTVDPKARAIEMLTHPTTRGYLEKDKKERERKQREEAVAAARQAREAEMKKAKERKQERERQNRIANEEKRRIANEEKRRIKEEENKRKNQLSKREKKKKLIQDRDLHLEKASTALLEGRSRQAYEDYQNAEIVMEESSGKYGSLTEGGRVIFLYAHGTAALETANPQILDERATEQSTETHPEGNETDNVSYLSTRVNELSIDNSQPSTEQVEPKVTDSSDGSAAAGVDDDDDEEDLYSDYLTPPMPLDANDRTYDDTDFSTAENSPLGATSNPDVCPSMLTSGPDVDFVTMPTEVNDPTRCLSYPVLQPEKDLARCICGEESGFDELRNEEGTLVGVQCRSCFGAWLTTEVARKSNRMKITWEGRQFYLNAPIHLNTTKLDTSPVSDTSELRRGDHIMLDRGVYIHHAIVVSVTSSGVKLMHWQYETPKIEPRIVYETKSGEELAGVSKVLYAKEDPVELVIARAAWAKVHGGEEYHISENNCESFATFCKTGHYVSLEGKVLRKFFPRIIGVFEYFFGQRQNPNEVHAVSRSTPDLRSID